MTGLSTSGRAHFTGRTKRSRGSKLRACYITQDSNGSTARGDARPPNSRSIRELVEGERPREPSFQTRSNRTCGRSRARWDSSTRLGRRLDGRRRIGRGQRLLISLPLVRIDRFAESAVDFVLRLSGDGADRPVPSPHVRGAAGKQHCRREKEQTRNFRFPAHRRTIAPKLAAASVTDCVKTSNSKSAGRNIKLKFELPTQACGSFAWSSSFSGCAKNGDPNSVSDPFSSVSRFDEVVLMFRWFKFRFSHRLFSLLS